MIAQKHFQEEGQDGQKVDEGRRFGEFFDAPSQWVAVAWFFHR